MNLVRPKGTLNGVTFIVARGRVPMEVLVGQGWWYLRAGLGTKQVAASSAKEWPWM